MRTFRLERIDTPIGETLLVTDEAETLLALDWADHEGRLQAGLDRRYRSDGYRLAGAGGQSAARRAVDAYFAGEVAALDTVRTQAGGTGFQGAVWQALREIPAGQTISYGMLAERIGRPRAVRAVGLANGANPIPVVVPCHRVIGADGTLTGFGGGLDRKRWLLAHEGVMLMRHKGDTQATLL